MVCSHKSLTTNIYRHDNNYQTKGTCQRQHKLVSWHLRWWQAQVWISFPLFVAWGWCRDQSKERRNIATCSPDKGRAYSSSRDHPRGRSLDDCEGNPQWRVSRSLGLDPDLHRLDERQYRLLQGYCWPVKVSEIPNERVPCQQAQTSHHSEEVRQGMVQGFLPLVEERLCTTEVCTSWSQAFVWRFPSQCSTAHSGGVQQGGQVR